MATASSTSKPLRRDAAANRARMLAAAERVFADQGLDASVDAVIAAAGVGPGTFYRRFPDKDALVAELVGTVEQRLADLVRHAIDDNDDGDGLERFMIAAGDELQTHRGLLARLWTDDPRPEHVRLIREGIATLLRTAQQQGRIAPEVAPADISMALWAIGGIIETTAAVSPDVWRRHLHVVVEGMRSTDLHHHRAALTAAELASITCSNRTAR